MMDLIDRAALKTAIRDYANEPVKLNDRRWNTKCTAIIEDMIGTVNSAPTIEAVPLDKLCEWLSEHSVNIPCETCRHFSNDYCTAIGDMDKPCPNKAEYWQKAIKEWMEGLDAAD